MKAEQQVRDELVNSINGHARMIVQYESLIAQLEIEIGLVREENGDVESLEKEKAGREKELRTERLLKGAEEKKLLYGKSAAGEYLGENIGKMP